ncbi:MAG TPA: restriction endonuclease [Mycobacterium sp.]|uniref:restriction endonuclease n=1 Tax=Mycobacterium sp. TaxID=1785 RepID=UPI002CEEC4C0|nr:restriction endonuclease [Mycobacterium sp.]HME75047.1 restriction endonuclease [Mycobacterium sp.]
MARVEWTRQSGEDVEAVVAMLLCSRYPSAHRVRPSQGDGGIDIFVPGPARFGAERAVYQVKRYCENLTGTQKRKIKNSYQRVVETSQKEGWRITEWHLVMPLDLTNQNLGWLDKVIADADFPCEPNAWSSVTRWQPIIPRSSTTSCATARTACRRRWTT